MGRFTKARTLATAFWTILVLNFTFLLHQASIAYVNSSFLGEFFGAEAVGFVFSGAAVCTILALAALPAIVRFLGTRTLLIILIPVAQLATLLLGFTTSPVAAVIFFIIESIAIFSLLYLLDLYLESITKDEGTTGNVRGMFLTSANLAIFFSPLMIALFVAGTYYAPLYAFASAALIPAFALSLTSARGLTPITPKRASLTKALLDVIRSRPSIAAAMGCYTLLQIFFAWVVIYAPLYLVGEGGLSWQAVGLLTAFALIPYLLIAVPFGTIADRWLGETEIMAAGFLILGVATASLSLIPLSLLVVWSIAFFATRVGAALVEIAVETYFFKQVNEDDAALVSLFRMIRSVGTLAGPLIALAFLPVTGLQYVFGVFGAILLTGIPLSLAIKDTK